MSDKKEEKPKQSNHYPGYPGSNKNRNYYKKEYQKTQPPKKDPRKDPVYYHLLKVFDNYCKHHSSQSSIYYSNDFTNLKRKEVSYSELRLTSQLSEWIYTPKTELPNQNEFTYKDIVLSNNVTKQVNQYAILKSNKKVFLVFKGTDVDNIFDCLQDTSIIPMPIWVNDPNQNIVNNWQFSVYSGVYCGLMRDYVNIIKTLQKLNKSYKKEDSMELVVCGHSLGGGLSILFGLQCILNNFNCDMKIITFGSPCVISIEKEFWKLNNQARKYLLKLHSITTTVINAFDPIPRIPVRTEWFFSVIPYSLTKILADQLKEVVYFPTLLESLVKKFGKIAFSKLTSYMVSNSKLFESYKFIGQYHIYTNPVKDPYILNNPDIVNKILSYTPPFKHLGKNNKEVKVIHWAHNEQYYMHKRKFSFDKFDMLIKDKLITDIDSIKGNLDMDNIDENINENIDDIDSSYMKQDDNSGFDKTHNIEMFINVKDDKVAQKDYAKGKLTAKGWLQVIGNHDITQYVSLFEGKNPESMKYPIIFGKSNVNNHYFGKNNNNNTNIKQSNTKDKDSIENKANDVIVEHKTDAEILDKIDVYSNLNCSKGHSLPKSVYPTLTSASLFSVSKSMMTENRTMNHKHVNKNNDIDRHKNVVKNKTMYSKFRTNV